MIARLEYIKDIVGNNYIGINIYSDTVFTFLQRLKEYIGDDFDEYTKNQQDRDLGHYHCTVLNVAEYNKIISADINNVNILNEIMTSVEFDLKLLGLGSAQRNGNKAYFIVCSSEKLQEFRRRFGFEEKDFHITLGFKWKDVHGVRKNQILPDKEPFIEEISKYFFDFNESFNFLKELEGFDFDITKDIYCVKIKPTYAEFRVGNAYGVADYFTIAIIANKLTIACKWQSSEEIPYLSHTLILRKFKNYEDSI